MIKKAKLLIIEDEAAILRGLTDLFIFHGFDVASEQDGRKGLETALSGNFDCILLDVMLPSMDGFSVCNAIRKVSREQPIVMLTAKSSEEDIINGLTLGADDYIAKPFSVQELVLRIKTILRRTGWDDEESCLNLNENISIDKNNLSGTVNGQPTIFTRREVDILTYLHRHNRPVPRTELLAEVWGYDKPGLIDTRTVDIHIAKLRKKIESNSKAPKLLLTFRGEGYKLMVK
ncbi:MAG: response regulator transcription factor [Colwellia sp.]